MEKDTVFRFVLLVNLRDNVLSNDNQILLDDRSLLTSLEQCVL